MNLNSSNKTIKIGDIFTPTQWGEFAIKEFCIFDDWLKGATVFDPTMGEGHLLEALILYGLKKNYTVSRLPTHNLFGNEINSKYHQTSIAKFKDQFGLNMSNNFTNEDILKLKPQQYDIILGNPPWQNFVDLPITYKEDVKDYFIRYDLVENKKDLLLGGSRIDIAALVIQVSIHNFLKDNGNSFFFMPLSLLLNDGANQHFRKYKIDSTVFAPKKIFDFNSTKVFKNVSTRYGLVHFKKNESPEFPLSYFRLENEKWTSYFAYPAFNKTDPLSISKEKEVDSLKNFSPIVINKESTPRQGINTCGANSVFFFDHKEDISEDNCLLNGKFELPNRFVYPLLTSKNFKENGLIPYKWVLLPYRKDGKPLEQMEIDQYPTLKNYLLSHKEVLEKRKGTMISSWINKGYWWVMLGVGPYNFFPYKIVWEAYGKKTFNPIIVSNKWQANQSLQAFIPLKDMTEAETVIHQLKNPLIENYLLSLKMEGTMNWAQPGKIKKFIKFREPSLTLFG
jgi:hypothetical protein